MGSLTSTVTELLGNLDITNLGLDVVLGGVFNSVREIIRWPLVLLERKTYCDRRYSFILIAVFF